MFVNNPACCCGTMCGVDPPETLYATFGSANPFYCSCAHTAAITLTYTGVNGAGNHEWTGLGTFGSCGFPAILKFEVRPACDAQLTMTCTNATWGNTLIYDSGFNGIESLSPFYDQHNFVHAVADFGVIRGCDSSCGTDIIGLTWTVTE